MRRLSLRISMKVLRRSVPTVARTWASCELHSASDDAPSRPMWRSSGIGWPAGTAFRVSSASVLREAGP
jgi:hypothetical protein